MQEASKAGSAHRAQVMACAVVSIPAMKKMLSSLHMRVKGSGARAWRCRCMRWLPMEASCARSRAPLHHPLTPQQGRRTSVPERSSRAACGCNPLAPLAEPAWYEMQALRQVRRYQVCSWISSGEHVTRTCCRPPAPSCAACPAAASALLPPSACASKPAPSQRDQSAASHSVPYLLA